MKWRLLVLLVILAVRIAHNMVSVSRYQNDGLIKVTGKVTKLDQKATICIVKVGAFFGEVVGKCQANEGDRISLVGRMKVGLTDRLMGRIWLTDAQIRLIDSIRTDPELGIQGPSLKKLRERLVEVGQKLLPEPEAGLVLGVVLGYKASLASSFYRQLINSGTIHIVVASGYNLMVVGSFALALFLLLFKRRRATVFSILFMIFYAVLAGGEPPVIRAALMGAVGLIGLAIGRQSQVVWALVLTLFVMLIYDPMLIESISFQLSAASSLGIFWLKPRVEKVLKERGKIIEILLRTEFLATLSATILTAPIIWWHFGRLSLIGLLSNILILPIVPILMLWGGIMLILGLIYPWVILALPAYALSHLIVVLVRIFG